MGKIKVVKTKSQKARIVYRLKIARGYLTKLIKMVEDNSYCKDTITRNTW